MVNKNFSACGGRFRICLRLPPSLSEHNFTLAALPSRVTGHRNNSQKRPLSAKTLASRAAPGNTAHGQNFPACGPYRCDDREAAFPEQCLFPEHCFFRVVDDDFWTPDDTKIVSFTTNFVQIWVK